MRFRTPAGQRFDDPVVRRTVLHLRLSILAVVSGVLASMLLAGLVVSMAYKDGRADEAATAKPTTADSAQQTGSNGTRTELASNDKQPDGKLLPSSKRAAGEKQAVTQDSSRPDGSTLLLLFGGFGILGIGMFLAVRRPYGNACENAAELSQAYRTLQESSLETYAALNATVEAKDRYTAGHGLRVTLVSLLIGQELGLSEEELDMLRHAATFHDIGKIAVPDHVLQKEGRLTPTEFEAMKVHPVESARICGKVAALRKAVPLIRHHHERMDGRGYPDALVGEAIPLGARIIAVADTWDAITSDRPYRRGQPATVALDEIRRSSGSQFDARVVQAFWEVLAKDPWMFGLTPLDVRSSPAAPGQRVELPSMSADELSADIRSLVSSEQPPVEPDIDWSAGFDEEDLAA